MNELEEELKDSKHLIEKQRVLLLTPQPAVDFGQKGEQYTAEAFRFGGQKADVRLITPSPTH
jgi:hypothetical protein